MDEMFHSNNFDTIVGTTSSQEKGWSATEEDWPDDDKWKLRKAARIVIERSEEPQFVFTFLLSTHYPYTFPPQFRKYQPSSLQSLLQWLPMDSEILRNRYKNSTSFLEHELLAFINSLDLQKNLVIITGDHGESLGEDGVFAHGSRKSEVQCRTPCIILGAGVCPGKTQFATSHTDIVPTLMHLLEGKSVPLQHIHGRDIVSSKLHSGTIVVSPPRQLEKIKTLLVIDQGRRSLFNVLLESPGGPLVGFVDHLDEFGRPLSGSTRR